MGSRCQERLRLLRFSLIGGLKIVGLVHLGDRERLAFDC
jgi:hypothetical protein